MKRISSIPIGLLDARYVNVSGDTMTGGLTITPATDTLTALVVNDKDTNNILTIDTVADNVNINQNINVKTSKKIYFDS